MVFPSHQAKLERFNPIELQEPGILTRWAPDTSKWSYNPSKWPYKWVDDGVITLLIGIKIHPL